MHISVTQYERSYLIISRSKTTKNFLRKISSVDSIWKDFFCRQQSNDNTLQVANGLWDSLLVDKQEWIIKQHENNPSNAFISRHHWAPLPTTNFFCRQHFHNHSFIHSSVRRTSWHYVNTPMHICYNMIRKRITVITEQTRNLKHNGPRWPQRDLMNIGHTRNLKHNGP